jgi:hypothetical protein
VLYAIVFVGVLLPLLVVGTTTLVRSTADGELQRAADAGALAGAAAIPFGDPNFARNFLSATAGGPTDQTLQDLGLSFGGDDPLDIACRQVAQVNADDPHNIGHSFATPASCHPSYLSDLATLSAIRDCATGLVHPPVGVPAVPDLSPLLPALLYPGVQVQMNWHVTGPLDKVINGAGADQNVTAIAHRRFKNMVVVPAVTPPHPGLPGNPLLPPSPVDPPGTIDLNPVVRDVRNTALDALDETEQLLAATPLTAGCATFLDGAQDDILDAISPPSHGPDAQQIIDDAAASDSPLVVARLVSGLGIPYLDFVPVCVERTGGVDIGHLGDFGSCSVAAPGGFRASLRRS